VLRPLYVISIASLLSVLPIPESASRAQPARAAASPADALLGEWWTEGNEGRVRFSRDRDGTFRGTTSCCVTSERKPGEVYEDIHNPNPKLRTRSTLGIVIIWKLSYEDDGEYTGGHVYNPRDGKTYRFEAKLLDKDTVKIRGYLGIPLLGQSQVWKRHRGPTR
jgi:uncharacterized protein (DUF2147 family)